MAQIQFKGKSFVQNHHLLVKYHELIPKQNKSLTDKVSLHDNLIIHGDNLKALKALLPLYAGKIKCIYIDPPYNTGNEKWVYNDNVNSPMMQEWLGKVVDREDLTRHDKWLCMMTPRLKLLRELMTDEGIIFASIDNNEAHRLRMIMDEVFGEDNFVEELVWKKSYGGGAKSKHIVNLHEYILMYARNKGAQGEYVLPPAKSVLKYYRHRDGKHEVRGPYRLQPLATTSMDERPNLRYPIPYEGEEIWPEKQWQWSRERTMQALENEELVVRKVKGKWTVNYKQYLRDEAGEERGRKPFSILEEAYTQQGTNEVAELLGSGKAFSFPKPSALIAHLLRFTAQSGSVVLDCTAGSGTTAHAVLALNKEDGGNRRFILVECEDYADKITAERVRRVIKGVPTSKDEYLKNGLGGTFSYFELGKAIELESILSGDGLPTYEELARYIFYTATGEEFDPKAMNQKKNFVGESRNYKVYLFYAPDIEKLKNIALTLDRAKSIGKPVEKRRLVFAPTKYLDQAHLEELRIDFAQLPFEIYELAR